MLTYISIYLFAIRIYEYVSVETLKMNLAHKHPSLQKLIKFKTCAGSRDIDHH